MKITPVRDVLLIKRAPIEEKRSSGGIILDADLTQDQKERMQNVGTVLAMGPEAYNDTEHPSCKVGDLVYFKETAGRNVKHEIDGELPPNVPNCVLILDTDVLGVAEK